MKMSARSAEPDAGPKAPSDHGDAGQSASTQLPPHEPSTPTKAQTSSGSKTSMSNRGPASNSASHASHDGQMLQALPVVSAPRVIGVLAGPNAKHDPADVKMYGTDMGLSVEHAGKLYMLFGDTWAASDTICNQDPPDNDDSLITLPLQFDGAVPTAHFITQPDHPDTLSRILLYRDGESLSLGYVKAPVAAFSDGVHSYGIFERLEPVHCDATWAKGAEACPTSDHFSCDHPLGICDPPLVTFPVVCDLVRNDTCVPNQTCVAASLCVDETSSQYEDGHFEGLWSSVAHSVEIAAARDSAPQQYDSVLSFATNKFSQPAARTVAKFTGRLDGNDYRPGHDTLLLWGRPGFLAEHGREAQLYLMAHRLPLELDGQGKLRFEPQYFAGVDPATGEPKWSSRQSEAKPIALDGKVGGSPHEVLGVPGPMAVSWLGAPINKWVMLYGGDFADYLMLDPGSTRSSRAPGAIAVRFADHPWGPFSPPQPHLIPGSPLQVNAPYGPGGYMYHPDCVDTPQAKCARSDPERPVDTFVPGCPVANEDPGRLYAPNIIDSYSGPNKHGGFDLVWNVSTWNPYAVQLMRTEIDPPGKGPLPPNDELADAAALTTMQDFADLPKLDHLRRYEQQSSYDRTTDDTTFPLTGNGNRDFNNFVCASADAQVGQDQWAPFHYDEPQCAESYVHGVVLARFEGSGHMARMWLGMQSLLTGPADDEMLRIYVDDQPTPRVNVPLAQALDGRAGEIFAPPFGAGSARRMGWYYPVVFRKKLIVALDRLGSYDNYFYHCDVVYDETPSNAALPSQRLPQRDQAARALSEVFAPSGLNGRLLAPTRIELAPDESHDVELKGPATLTELRVRVDEPNLAELSSIQVQVSWDDAKQPAIDLPLSDLLGGSVPPERSNEVLTSFLEESERVLALKLPMPFAKHARLRFRNDGHSAASFELRVSGEHRADGDFGYLHVQPSETLGPTTASVHRAVHASGRGRLVGVCGQMQGHADPAGGIQADPLNLLEGDVRAEVDGRLALHGTGTEEYADDVFYFTDAPHENAFVQAWGVADDANNSPSGRASFCRWHVYGTELDFKNSLELTFELGGAGNPNVVERVYTVAYLYQDKP